MAILNAMQEHRLQTRNLPRTEEWNPYIIRPEKFGPVANHIKAKRPQLAMDQVDGIGSSNQIAVQAWQAGGLISNAVSEGLLFLGYPFLSELAQRPEFRMFGEIRAQEMTRKWIEFRPTKDESTKEDDDESEPNEQDEQRAREKRKNGEGPRSDKKNKEVEDKIKELNDAMEEFRVRDWFKNVAEQDSYFGISHLLIDTKGTNPENMLDPELSKSIGNGRDPTSEAKLEKGFLRGFRIIEPIWVYPTTYNAVNPLLPSWYDPQVWYVMGTEIHKTRLLTFIGRPVPDILKPAYAFGGLAMTQMAQPYVKIWLRTRESVGELIHAFSIMILSTNLATTTMPGGSGGGAGDVLARLALMNMLRDNQGVFAIDKNTEDFKNVSAPLSGLDELQAQSQEHMFSVGRIPAIKFAGIQPKGLNATSEGELRAFYDTIVAEQNHLFRPGLNSVADMIQIHLWGACDRDITYDFIPLMEQTDKEKAEIRKIDAETSQILIDSGQISQEEGRRRLATDPESGYHEIDPDDVPELLEEEEAGLVPPGAGRALEGVVGEEEGGGPPPKQKGSSVTPFAKGRANDAADEFRESEHPRDKDGKFTSGGGGGGSSGTEAGEGGQGELKLEPPGKAKTDVISELLKKGATSKDILGATGWKAINIPRVALALGLRLEKVGNVYKGVPMGPQELEGARLDAKRKAAELKAKKAGAGELKPPPLAPPPPAPKPEVKPEAPSGPKGPTLKVSLTSPTDPYLEFSERVPLSLAHFRDRVATALNKLPDGHRAMLADIRFEIEPEPEEGATHLGKGYAGYYNPSGFVRMPAKWSSGMQASNEANVIAHESAHAIDHKYGWALGDMIADQVNNDAEQMMSHERDRAKYWFSNNNERFAELYALAYSPGPTTRFFGGMERRRAERIFAKSLERLRSLKIGEADGPLGTPEEFQKRRIGESRRNAANAKRRRRRLEGRG